MELECDACRLDLNIGAAIFLRPLVMSILHLQLRSMTGDSSPAPWRGVLGRRTNKQFILGRSMALSWPPLS